MHKIFLSVASMIVTGFLLKSYNKLREKPETKEEIYHRMKKAEYDRRRAAARPTIAKLDAISTPRDGSSILNQIGTVSELEAALRPYHRAKDCADAMAMAIGSCNG